LGGPAGQRWSDYAWSVGVTACATLVSLTLFRHREPTNYLIVYLVGVLVVASRFGFRPSALAALLSVLASDFLLIPPYFSFAVARPEDVVTLGVFLLAGLTVSHLTASLRSEGERARRREQRIRFLYEFTLSLAQVRTVEEAAAIAARQLSRELPWNCELWPAGADGRLQAAQTAAGAAAFDGQLAQWVFDNRKAAGWSTEVGTERRELYLPVSSSTRRFGVLMLRPRSQDILMLPDQRHLVDTVVSQIAQTMERIRLAEEAQAATVAAQTEALRNSLLSAIAHDLRTPLASIVAASGTLLQDERPPGGQQARELARTIHDEARHMSRLADKTLEMARLEAGTVRLQREWCPVEEIIGAALSRVEESLGARPVRTQTPAEPALAHVDAVLVVRVLENLIENAIKYTPAGSPIEVGADVQGAAVRFRVADSGRGLAPGEETRIFEKFYRGSARDPRPGVGLGLTICRLIVEAHGGRIGARNRPEGGAEFCFTIPSGEPAPPLDAAP
jgi:two-component system sensor histidine kinase KdpD